jgi:hypothetical protein
VPAGQHIPSSRQTSPWAQQVPWHEIGVTPGESGAQHTPSVEQTLPGAQQTPEHTDWFDGQQIPWLH